MNDYYSSYTPVSTYLPPVVSNVLIKSSIPNKPIESANSQIYETHANDVTANSTVSFANNALVYSEKRQMGEPKYQFYQQSNNFYINNLNNTNCGGAGSIQSISISSTNQLNHEYEVFKDKSNKILMQK